MQTWTQGDIRRSPGRSRARDVDRHVGRRLRKRRVHLGLTQQQMAERIGVTYQQGHKYEKGINRMAASRLYDVAKALGVEVGYFFEGLGDSRAKPFGNAETRMVLEVSRIMGTLPVRLQQIVGAVARELAKGMNDK